MPPWPRWPPGLAALLNAPATTNLTQVAAFAHGDRIELHSLATNGLAAPFYFTDCGATNRAGRYYRTALSAGRGFTAVEFDGPRQRRRLPCARIERRRA